MTNLNIDRNHRAAIRPKLPEWLKVTMPGSPRYLELKQLMRGQQLHTVCEEAHCPNIGECWGRGTATFMILGEICTRPLPLLHRNYRPAPGVGLTGAGAAGRYGQDHGPALLCHYLGKPG